MSGFAHGSGRRADEVSFKAMHVEAREGEPFDQLLRRFKTGIDKAGILREYKRKQRFKSAGELRREKAKAAARRRTKRPRARTETRR
jgi:ribosomal protein S21